MAGRDYRFRFKGFMQIQEPTIVIYISCHEPVAFFQMHFRLDFFMEINTMNPDQTAPKAAV